MLNWEEEADSEQADAIRQLVAKANKLPMMSDAEREETAIESCKLHSPAAKDTG